MDEEIEETEIILMALEVVDSQMELAQTPVLTARNKDTKSFNAQKDNNSEDLTSEKKTIPQVSIAEAEKTIQEALHLLLKREQRKEKETNQKINQVGILNQIRVIQDHTVRNLRLKSQKNTKSRRSKNQKRSNQNQEKIRIKANQKIKRIKIERIDHPLHRDLPHSHPDHQNLHLEAENQVEATKSGKNLT